jgi:tape measure domain-containing protein
MQGAEVLTKFTADSSQMDNATKKIGNSFGDLTKAIALGNIASQAFNKTLSMITSNMDSAISRVDIMNNFPKVMKNLGIESKEAEKSIALMSDKLVGLPTMLDEGAMAVQRFTSANGDVAESTKIFLAVNNAILAGGANAQIQATALEQLSQAYAKGKPDMMEWRTLMTAMPAQLKQVALAMGYVNAADLGEAVRAKGGEAEFQRMIETIKRLNVEGENGFASLEEQARGATGGIATSVKNMKNAFVRGVADIINKTNEALQPFGGITGVLGTIGKVGEQAFKALGSAISFVIPHVINIVKWIKEHKEIIVATMVPLVAFIATFKTISTVIGIINGVKTAFMALSAVMSANPIGVVVGLIVALIATFALLWNKCEAFRNFWKGLWTGIKATFLVVVTGIKSGITSVINAFKKIATVVTSVWNGIKSTFSKMTNGMINIGKNIGTGLWNGLKSMKDWVIDKVKGMGKAILGGLKKVLGIKSPSKEFAIVGKYSAEGYVEGLDGMQKEIDKSVNATFNPFTNGSIGSMTTPTPTANVTIHNSMEMDSLGQLVNSVKTFSGGAKNDYNYVGGY